MNAADIVRAKTQNSNTVFKTLPSRILALLPWFYGYILAYTIPSNW